MNKKNYWLALALLLAALALAACGSSGSATGSGEVTNPPPTTDTTSGEANGASGADTQGGDVVTEGANGSNDLSGPGDASGGNAGNAAGSATDVGSGSDGAKGSGGSNQAGGSQAPNQPNGAVTEGDATGNSASGTGDTGSSQGTAGGTDSEGAGSGGTAAGGPQNSGAVTNTDATGAQGNAGAQDNVAAAAAVTGTNSTGTNGTQAGAAQSGTAGAAAGAQAAPGAAGGYTPVDDTACTEAQNQLTQALGLDVNRSTAPAAFQDLSGGTGQSCQLIIAATGAQFPNMVDAGQRIAGALTANGWTLDPQYAADSPTGTMHGLRRDNQLAVYNVQWAPAAGITCPADQPIATCAESLTPEQMTYTITVDLAQQ